MVIVISRPIGHKLGTTEIDAEISDYAGDAVVYVPGGHSLSDGDYIFIESNFDSYKGFKYVDSIAYDHFKLRESEGGDYVPYKQDADITFYISELDHGFQSVHLPIVYELESDLYPNNTIEESYTNRVVSFAADSNGYTGIQASTDFLNISDLDYIEFIGDGPLAGVYQILEVVDNDEIIIDLAWDADNVFSGYELRKYYNNYFITVDVYGGLESSHRWAADKPFELLATLKLIPDSNNRVKFSINEILKGQITTRNNLTLDQLPNNLDFYTQFYIEYAEVYDVSDGVDITSVAQDSVDDSVNFIGDAINSKYEFKSLNQSFASEYVDSENVLARWLTTQDRPIAVVGYFFDLSFINQYEGNDIKIIIFKSYLGVVSETETLTLENPGTGIIRVPIEIDENFDLYCVYAGKYISSAVLNITLPSLTLWSSVNITPGTTAWTTGASPSVVLAAATNDVSDVLITPYAFIPGAYYEITFVISSSASWTGSEVYLRVYTSANTSLGGTSITSIVDPSGNKTFTLILLSAPATAVKLGVTIKRTSSASGSSTYSIVSVAGTITQEEETVQITEQICIDIVSDCNTFTNDDLRLTEGGVFRELE